jgi:hypothetical protein
VAAVAGTTLGVTTLLGLTFQGSGEAEQRDASMLKEGLLTTANRDRLAICVQAVGVDSSLETKAKASIEAALIEVAKHPYWEPAGYAVAESPVVDIGCPASPPPLDLEAQSVNPPEDVQPSFVSEPSYYRLFVFVLPQGDVDTLVSGLPRLRTGSQEVVCEGDSCGTVTSGVYIGAEELGDLPLLADALQQGLGLELPY